MYEFEWDEKKNIFNQRKHHVSFELAQFAFLDPKRMIFEDADHSTIKEKRWFCLGVVHNGVLTVRFTHRDQKIRIFGAGYWRQGKSLYEKENKIHK